MDEALDPLGVFERHLDRGAVTLLVARLSQGLLEIGVERSDRSLELVGSVGDEALLRGHQCGEVLDHRVDVARELRHLAVDGLSSDSRRQISRCNTPGDVGDLALLATRTNFSVSAAMGFLSIFGIAIQDAILVVTYFQQMRYKEGLTVREAARGAAEKRFRPVLMTTLVAMLGLMPAALSHGIGSQTQKPLAIAVIGGSLILAMMTRIIRPPLLLVTHEWWEAWRIRRGMSVNPFVSDDDAGLESADPHAPRHLV